MYNTAVNIATQLNNLLVRFTSQTGLKYFLAET